MPQEEIVRMQRALRPQRSLRQEKCMKLLCEADSGPRLEMVFVMVVVANWGLDDAKSPAAMPQEEIGRTPHTLRLPGSCRR